MKSLSDDIVTNLRNYGTISHVPAATMALAGLVYFLLRQSSEFQKPFLGQGPPGDHAGRFFVALEPVP